MAGNNIITVPCPHCKASLKVKAQLSGKQVRCPRKECGGLFEVPVPPAQIADESQDDLIAAFTQATSDAGLDWRRRFGRGVKVVPCWILPLNLLITLNIYHVFWLYRMFKVLYELKATKTSPGNAVAGLLSPSLTLFGYSSFGTSSGQVSRTPTPMRGCGNLILVSCGSCRLASSSS